MDLIVVIAAAIFADVLVACEVLKGIVAVARMMLLIVVRLLVVAACASILPKEIKLVSVVASDLVTSLEDMVLASTCVFDSTLFKVVGLFMIAAIKRLV